MVSNGRYPTIKKEVIVLMVYFFLDKLIQIIDNYVLKTQTLKTSWGLQIHVAE